MPKPITNSLAVLTSAKIADKRQLAAFQANTAEQLAIIDRTENLNVTRRLYVGLAFHCIKNSLDYGKWMPWLKQNAKGQSLRQCQYMMKAALRFIAEEDINAPQITSLPMHDETLAVTAGAGRKVAAAAGKFIDGMSWGELLAFYDIKDTSGKLGGARTGKGGKAEALDAEQLYLFSRDEIGGALQRAEELLLKENRLQHLIGHPEEVRGVVESLRTLADRVEKAAKPLLKTS